MRVLITNPPWPGPGYGARSDVRWPHKRSDKYLEYPIYLAYAAAVLREDDFDVRFLDGIVQEMDIPDFAEAVAQIKPELVVIECSTPSINYDLATAAAVKEALPGVRTALVGSHSTYFHRQMLAEHSQVDFILRGEFEYTLRDLARTLADAGDLAAVTGLSYRHNGDVRVNSDRPLEMELDRFPFPDRTIVPNSDYRSAVFEGGTPTTMITSRGCPAYCTFCLWPETLYGHRFRARSAANVVDEIQQVVEEYGVDEISFDDDTFTFGRKRLMEMMRLIRERGLHKHVRWRCQSRVDTVDRESLIAMRDAGCNYIYFGIESGSQELLDRMRKGISLEKVRETFALTKEVGIKRQAFFLFGMPGETHETIQQSIDLAIELEPDSVQFAVAIAHPGTRLYEEAKAKGWLRAEKWEDFAAERAMIETPELTLAEVEQARIDAYRQFYFRPQFMVRTLLQARGFNDLRRIYNSGRSIMSRIRFFEQHSGAKTRSATGEVQRA